MNRRMILINPFDRTVSEVVVSGGKDSLDAIRKALGGPGFPLDDTFPNDPADWTGLEREQRTVSLIDIISVGNGVDLIIDDEGRLANDQACFQLGPDPELVIGGRALIAGHDEEGNTTGIYLPLNYAAAPVKWLPYDFDYTPPPPKIMVWSEEANEFVDVED